MPINRRIAIIDAMLDGIHDSGYSGVLTTPVRRHPAKFALVSPEGRRFVLAAYAWTLTPGGRPSLPNEYRIQMTSVRSPLQEVPDEYTVLLGFEPSLHLFAGFDFQRHRRFTTGSPSVQIDITTVEQALQDGLAFHRKSNAEIALGVRPDQIVPYVIHGRNLHRWGRDPATLDLLTRASTLENIPDHEIDGVTAPRGRIVQIVSRLSRSANFRQTVMQAYNNRCAVSRLQLRLADAAHILPVTAPNSYDDVRNGIALSPTYHRAYDCGLIYLDSNYRMKINKKKISELRSEQLVEGLDSFQNHLGKIRLPRDKRQWPSPQYIARANRYRQIS